MDELDGLIAAIDEEGYRGTCASRAVAKDELRAHVRSLVEAERERAKSLAGALKHVDDDARESGLTYDWFRRLLREYEDGEKSMGRFIEDIRSAARVMSERERERCARVCERLASEYADGKRGSPVLALCEAMNEIRQGEVSRG